LAGYNDHNIKKRRPFLKFLGRLFIFFFIFLLGFGLARRWGKEGITGERIGVIEVKGIIKDSRSILENIVKFEKNDHIKAILLRINSPGGAVAPCQEIYIELIKARKKKPVVASLGTVAASGGYYIAAAANKIIATPGTLTGSIGVKLELANVQKLLEKIGIEPVVLKSVPYKDIGSPFRQVTPEEKKMLIKLLKDIHRQFVEDIAKGRHLSFEKVEAIADGSVFTGKEAKDLGLVDMLGNFEDAIKEATRLAGIKGEPKLYYPKKKTPWTRLLLNTLLEILNEDIQKIKISY